MSQAGNCTLQDDTALLQSGTSTYVPPDKDTPPHQEDEFNPFEVEAFAGPDHTYDTRRLSLLIENVVVYVAGWVVRKIIPALSCNSCRVSLVSESLSPSHYKESFHLLHLKQNGGLVVPSDACIHVILTTEKHIRQIQGDHMQYVNKNLSLLRLQTKVIGDIGKGDIFDNPQHALDTQNGIENHHFSLIRLLVSTYYTVRHHHIVKLHNSKMQGKSIRHLMTKTILFKGQ